MRNLVLFVGLVVYVGAANAAPTPEEKCEAGKKQEAGKYAFCRLKAEAKLAKGGDPGKYADSLTKCEAKFLTKFDKLEEGAEKKAASCPTVDDGPAIEADIATTTQRISAALSGQTSQSDNGNGTLTDLATGLTWEKKVRRNSLTDIANPQDADNVYRWSGTCAIGGAYCQPNATSSAACLAAVEGDSNGCAQCTSGACNVSPPGVTIWQWVAGLNAANFGGFNDWRIPTKDELESILELDFTTWTPPVVGELFEGASCGGGCASLASPACSCTRVGGYWTASTYAPNPDGAWVVDFNDGNVTGSVDKFSAEAVRAVRGGGS